MPDFTSARTIHVLCGTEFEPVLMPLEDVAVLDPPTFATQACAKAKSHGAQYFVVPSVWIGGQPTRFRAYDVDTGSCGLDTTSKDAAEMWCIHREQADG